MKTIVHIKVGGRHLIPTQEELEFVSQQFSAALESNVSTEILATVKEISAKVSIEEGEGVTLIVAHLESKTAIKKAFPPFGISESEEEV